VTSPASIGVCVTRLGYGSTSDKKTEPIDQDDSSSRLLRGAAKGFFLKPLHCIKGLMGRPAMVVHQFHHQRIGPIGNPVVQVGDDTVIASKRIKAK